MDSLQNLWERKKGINIFLNMNKNKNTFLEIHLAQFITGHTFVYFALILQM